MAKRKSSKRMKRGRQRASPSEQIQAGQVHSHVPSATTFFRLHVLDRESRNQIDKAMALVKPLLWMRDGGSVRRIRQARTAEELIDLIPQSGGLGARAWYERMAEFGPEVLPIMSRRLRMTTRIEDEDLQSLTYDRLIEALRWRGDDGARVLERQFDALSDYGRGLASVALGLLGKGDAADRIWNFYRRAVRDRHETFFVGALWGLIDLEDRRVGGALAHLLERGQYFYELFGFLSLAGDARVILPLLADAVQRPKEENMDAKMALVSVVHRIGKEPLLAELKKLSARDAEESGEEFAGMLLSTPMSQVREYFSMFYRGLTAEDAAQVFPGGA